MCPSANRPPARSACCHRSPTLPAPTSSSVAASPLSRPADPPTHTGALMRRPLIAALLAVALVAGCGEAEPTSTSGTPLDDVEVSGEPGEKPTLEFDEPFELTESATRVLEEGDGEEIAPNAVVRFHYLFVNGRDGTELDTSYGTEPQLIVFEESLMPGIYQGLDGVPAGSEVL